MLRGLDIRDMLIIERLELAFQPGLNVLTGETGAGKSILLDSLGFVLGWRGRTDLVRPGAAQGEVTAVFELSDDHLARKILDEAGLPEDDELILRRTATPEGRKTAFVNDRRTSAEVLRALSESLVELHGQHDDRGLLNPRGHRDILDAFANTAPLLSETRRCWRALSAARKALTEAEAALDAARAEEDYLRHSAAELDKVSPQPGEEAELDARRRLMQSAARIREDIARAFEALGPQGAEGLVTDATRWLDGAADRAEGRLDAPLAALERLMIELGEAQLGVEDCLEALDFNPAELEATEERLFAIRALTRKHSCPPDELATLSESLHGKLAALDSGSDHIAALTAEVTAAETALAEACARLTAARRKAATRLDKAMAAELPPLKLDRARFTAELAAADPSPEGADTVAFTVATNPGAPPGPLDRIASGGELSRFLLALKVCLTRSAAPVTMIFDEIDRGVGGATADAVGRRLAQLATEAQVLVVTHSPQVAARAAHHWRVEKQVTTGLTTSIVTPLDTSARIDEIARMLAGDTITEAARAAARALLAG